MSPLSSMLSAVSSAAETMMALCACYALVTTIAGWLDDVHIGLPLACASDDNKPCASQPHLLLARGLGAGVMECTLMHHRPRRVDD